MMFKINEVKVFIDMRYQGCAFTYGLWPFKKIIVGRQFFQLSMDERCAVLLHEYGHCKHFHVERQLLGFLFPFGRRDRVIKREQQADDYAANAGFSQPLADALERRNASLHCSIVDTRIARLRVLSR